MPTLAQSVLPFECSVCGIEVTSTETNPHLSRRQCGRCKQRAYYAASVGKSVDELRSKKLGEHPDSVSRPAVVPMERLDCEQCGTPFVQRRRTQRNCSKACWIEAHKNRPRPISSTPCRLCGGPRDSRKHLCSGCLDDPQVWRACGRCGVMFNCAYISQGRALLVRKYCSNECRMQSVSESLSGKGKPPNAVCEQCGEPFTRGKQANKRFCSKICMRRADAQRNPPPTVTVRCAWCDKQCQQRAADVGRHRSGPFCDKDCAVAYRVCVLQRNGARPWPRTQPCVECGVNYPTKSNSAARCPDCRPVAKPKQRLRFVAGYCRQCGESFVIDRMRGMPFGFYCSIQCGKRAGKARRSARKRGAYVADVRRYRIFKRDGYRCKLCGKRLAMSKAAPHPKSPTIDHIIPLAEGGTHEPSNCQAAHFMCNAVKSNGAAPNGDQLLLIG